MINDTEPLAAPPVVQWSVRLKDFSNLGELRAAHEIERRTGLNAREVFRPARDTNVGHDLFPEDGRMRCQLGRIHTVTINQRSIENVCDAYHGAQQVFQLLAFGRTWAEAETMAKELNGK